MKPSVTFTRSELKELRYLTGWAGPVSLLRRYIELLVNRPITDDELQAVLNGQADRA